MISVATAKQIINSHSKTLSTIERPILQALGYALAQTIVSPIQFPAFRQSSMDGYAIYYVEKEKTLLIQDALPAGTSQQLTLENGMAIRVYTGGPIPDGADCVVQKEYVNLINQSIQIQSDRIVQLGDHIREKGSDLEKNTVLIEAGTVLRPAHIGLLASAGITQVPVIQKPSVAILITGNELVQPGMPLTFGKVYDSNAFSIQAHLQQLGIVNITVQYVNDNLNETFTKIAALVTQFDVLILTGGVSVGDFDFVPAACEKAGITPHFHKVKQRPGKPLFFGTRENRLVFGLPGNPAAVLSCLYQYVLPTIEQMSGTQTIRSATARLKAPFKKTIPLTQFLKGYYESGEVTVLPAQASYQLSALGKANCWIELDEEWTFIAAQQEVKIYLFI
ncbi:MAG: molybdopterin molybdenumtransferase MoeA [Sphingobacteriales bacterium]|uniref:molybdopterin molybdotransferase MoeA n=1 Tax=Hydrotalea flava TaxID=714549 RepID=UPI00082E162E|nr:gephyrin-like molybdotransferase Glp [Hydrotalea flava]RTL49329.1 MAG: molybdopterin molybdenumtransferase MoeA [Sphingobacteriales bacterium]